MSIATTEAIASLETATLVDTAFVPFLNRAAQTTPVVEASWLRDIRRQGADRLVQAHFPTRKDEAWRVTDVAILKDTAFGTATTADIQPHEVGTFALPETNASRLVFVNGVYNPQLSDISALPDGIFVGNLAALSPEQMTELAHYLGYQSRDLDVFAALNDAGIQDVAVIWADKNATTTQPIHVLFIGKPEADPTTIQSRCLAIAEPGSSLNLVEYYGAISQGCSDRSEELYFNNALTEIWVNTNAQVNHVRIQRESGAGIQIANTAIAQAQDSRYHLTEVNMGAQLSRHTLTLQQQGAQTETILRGLTMLGGDQVSDTHTAVNLNHPYGTVDQLHKCIVDDSARSIFNGKIAVPQRAQMTNATQLNRNLLLSPKARVDTKPELQITADNVKCAHGATVSQLEADEIFYLRSRGLNDHDARHLLIDAFAAEILDTIAIPSLQEGLINCVACRTMD